jgi:uncharacterized protein YceK
MKPGTAVLLLAMLPIVGGCGTLVNLHEQRDDGKPGLTPYGGVQYDAAIAPDLLSTVVRIPSSEGLWEFISPGACFVIGTYVLVVDLPLTGLADTLTLPYVLAKGPGKIPNTDVHPPPARGD